MNRFYIDYAFWLASRLVKKLGILGISGLLLIVGSGLIYAINLSQLEARIQTTHAEKENLMAHMHAQDAVNKQSQASGTTAEVAQFYDRFPTENSLPDALALMNASAHRNHLLLVQGDYQFNKVSQVNILNAQKLTRYEVALPIDGQYTQIRTFIAEILQQLPAAALTDLQLSRESSVSSTIGANVVFTLFVKGES
jgi:multidrug resistance efflux pump